MAIEKVGAKKSVVMFLDRGFTLIEMLVTMLIAMVVLAAVLLSFTQQNSEYNYQNKRIDAFQDEEFAIKFIMEDIASSLYRQVAGTDSIVIANTNMNGPGTDSYTAGVGWQVWDATSAALNHRVTRCYLFRGGSIRLDRDFAGTCDETTSLTSFAPILDNVTFFRVFQDTAGVTPTLGVDTPSGVPPGLPSKSMLDSNGTLVTSIPGYTILIEMAVDAGYKNGSFQDVMGVDVRTTADKRKRIWRYVQVYPGAVVQ